MKFLDVALTSNIENIALDEALLETAEAESRTDDENGQVPFRDELLRLWEPTEPVVVIGRSSPIETEVNLAYCREHGIEVIRRASGGQSVVNGPGCLLYSVLLDYRKRPELRMLETAHAFVMSRMKQAIESLGIDVYLDGTSDLTQVNDDGVRRKVSGNALRCKRNWMLYHGTMLCSADLELIFKCLGPPKRMPEYREGRSHDEFLTQLPVDTSTLRTAIIEQWNAGETESQWPREKMEQLVAGKYSRDDWNYKV